MFSYFLNPNRLLLSAFLLLMCSLFVVPIYRVDTHIIFLTAAVFYFIAFFKVRKKGVEFYAEKIRENKKGLIPLFVYFFILVGIEYFELAKINEQANMWIRVLVYIPIILISFIFFWRVFFNKSNL